MAVKEFNNFNNFNGYRWMPGSGLAALAPMPAVDAALSSDDPPTPIDPHAPRMLDLEPTREVATPAIAARKLDI